MKLEKPFHRLAVQFDAARLLREVDALPASAWSTHPTGYPGNSAVRLISVGGGENDDVAGGAMQATSALRDSPYLRQVLASFNAVWSRSRLMKLAPGAVVPEHADLSYHWFSRVRVHVPIRTNPDVRFFCGDRDVHMAAGDAWIFDNWRLHRVENRSALERVHLVADTTGSAHFWELVAAGDRGDATRAIPFRPGVDADVAMERVTTSRVIPPSEMEQLLTDLADELGPEHDDEVSRAQAAGFARLLQAFCRDWRQLWMLWADAPAGASHFAAMIASLRRQAAEAAANLVMRTNGMPAVRVLNARLQFAVQEPAVPLPRASVTIPAAASIASTPRFERPVIVIAAPRSGSSLLFETLAVSPQLVTVGGEAAWLVDSQPELQVGARGIEDNRLVAAQCTDTIADRMLRQLSTRLLDAQGRPWNGYGSARFLEKTPKNALRVPFFDRLFPDAHFVFLWRDPRESIGSITETWRTGRRITYPQLDGWDGPWSLLLPPGWRELRGRSLEEIAAAQWARTNAIAMDDLAALPSERWTVVSYGDLVSQSADTIRRVCASAGLAFDTELAARTMQPLPYSHQTDSPPDPNKWRAHETEIGRVLGEVESVWERLKGFGQA